MTTGLQRCGEDRILPMRRPPRRAKAKGLHSVEEDETATLGSLFALEAGAKKGKGARNPRDEKEGRHPGAGTRRRNPDREKET